MTEPGAERGALPRYLVAGVFTSLLDLGLFSLLAVVLTVPAVPANIVSTAVTICVSYFINQRLVFRSGSVNWHSFFSFAGLTLFTGLVLQSVVITVTLWVLETVAAGLALSIALPISKATAMVVGATCNFLGYRFIFRR